MVSDASSFRQLVRSTHVAYVRMAATVVIAFVVRLCLDCVGIIMMDKEPSEAGFWFAHCQKDGRCVLAGLGIFVMSLIGSSIFAWSSQGWITNPDRNPYARKFSFAVILEAATWIPISVSVGKTNAMVEYFMDISEEDMTQALLCSGVAALLTVSCAFMTHLAMTYCRGVMGKEEGLSGFGKFLLLSTLYCLSWAVGWSNWELVLSLMDALEPGISIHNTMLSALVLCGLFVFSVGFYVKFGPEPIIPDPDLQQACYNHGYSRTFWRSLISYVVYSCVVFNVMCFCDPTYGFIIHIAEVLYASSSSVFDTSALMVMTSIALVVTVLAALLSATITWAMEVDEYSSMKLSRSKDRACRKMVSTRRQSFDHMLARVLEAGSDAQFAAALRSNEECSMPNPSFLELTSLHGVADDEENADGTPPGMPSSYRPPGAPQIESEFLLDRVPDPQEDLASERQLQNNPVPVTAALTASVLAYDVLGLIVCFQWASVAMRCYSFFFGWLASTHDILYLLSCLLYAGVMVACLSRFCFAFCPSAEELALSKPKESEGPLYAAMS